MPAVDNYADAATPYDDCPADAVRSGRTGGSGYPFRVGVVSSDYVVAAGCSGCQRAAVIVVAVVVTVVACQLEGGLMFRLSRPGDCCVLG